MIKHLVQVDLREIQPATDLNSLHYATGLSHNKVARGHPCRTKHSDKVVLIGTRIPVSQGLIAVAGILAERDPVGRLCSRVQTRCRARFQPHFTHGPATLFDAPFFLVYLVAGIGLAPLAILEITCPANSKSCSKAAMSSIRPMISTRSAMSASSMTASPASKRISQ